MFYGMSPRRKPPNLSELLSANIREARESRESDERGEWTQAKVAERMNALGFAWTRTTVAEVEGTGRGRQVSIEEWLGLAEIFGVAAFQLLIPEDESTEITVAAKFSMESSTDLFARIADETMLSRVLNEAARMAWLLANRTVRRKVAARMTEVAKVHEAIAADARASVESLERDLIEFAAAEAIDTAAQKAIKEHGGNR